LFKTNWYSNSKFILSKWILWLLKKFQTETFLNSFVLVLRDFTKSYYFEPHYYWPYFHHFRVRLEQTLNLSELRWDDCKIYSYNWTQKKFVHLFCRSKFKGWMPWTLSPLKNSHSCCSLFLLVFTLLAWFGPKYLSPLGIGKPS